MSRTKILIVDDNRNLLEALKVSFSREGYDTVVAWDGIQALEAVRNEKPNLIVLDVMLPGMDGLEVCRIIRHESSTPILMLSAKNEEVDRVVGLELGADDYVPKPFSTRELLARVKACIRRSNIPQDECQPTPNPGTKIRLDNLELDPARHVFSKNGVEITLSPKEFELLAFLMKHQQHVFSRDDLVDKIWGYDYEGDTRTVDVHVVSLRKKIEDDPVNPKHLVSIRGVGYKFEAQNS